MVINVGLFVLTRQFGEMKIKHKQTQIKIDLQFKMTRAPIWQPATMNIDIEEMKAYLYCN